LMLRILSVFVCGFFTIVQFFSELCVYNIYSVQNEMLTQRLSCAHGRCFVPWQRPTHRRCGDGIWPIGHMSDHRLTKTGRRRVIISF